MLQINYLIKLLLRIFAELTDIPSEIAECNNLRVLDIRLNPLSRSNFIRLIRFFQDSLFI